MTGATFVENLARMGSHVHNGPFVNPQVAIAQEARFIRPGIDLNIRRDVDRPLPGVVA